MTVTLELIDTHSEAFARRLANLLAEHRRSTGRSLGQVARASGGRFSRADLRRAETGRRALPTTTIDELSALYGVDLVEILPARVDLQIDLDGVIRTAGVSTRFDPSDEQSLLSAYLRLVRRLRAEERAPAVELRRVDIEILAAALDRPGEVVVDQLGTLMGATRQQRTALIGTFAAGAAVIGLGAAFIAGGAPYETVEDAAGPSAAPPPALAMVDDVVDDERGTVVVPIETGSDHRDGVGHLDEIGPLIVVGLDEVEAPAGNEATDGAATDPTAADTPSTDTASTDTASGDTAPSDDGGSTDEPVDVEPVAKPDTPAPVVEPDAGVPAPAPMDEREPVMVDHPAPDGIEERDPVMIDSPAPDPVEDPATDDEPVIDTMVARGPVMVPMDAPENLTAT